MVSQNLNTQFSHHPAHVIKQKSYYFFSRSPPRRAMLERDVATGTNSRSFTIAKVTIYSSGQLQYVEITMVMLSSGKLVQLFPGFSFPLTTLGQVMNLSFLGLECKARVFLETASIGLTF